MCRKKNNFKVKECKECIYCEPYNKEMSLCYIKGEDNWGFVRHPFKCREGEPKEE